MSLSELMIDIPAEHEANVFGQFDAYAKKLERTFHVTLIARDGSMKIVGENTAAEKTHRVLTQLLELSRRGNTITEQNVDYAISLVFEDQEEGIVEIDRDLICHTLQGNSRTEKICRFYKGRNDHIRTWSGRNRKNIFGNGNGDYSI